MKVKVVAALMMAVAMSLAAFASEQRRMCHEGISPDDRTVIADEGREATVIAIYEDVTN